MPGRLIAVAITDDVDRLQRILVGIERRRADDFSHQLAKRRPVVEPLQGRSRIDQVGRDHVVTGGIHDIARVIAGIPVVTPSLQVTVAPGFGAIGARQQRQDFRHQLRHRVRPQKPGQRTLLIPVELLATARDQSAARGRVGIVQSVSLEVDRR